MSERRAILLKNLTLNEEFIFLFFLWFNLITKLYLKNNTNILNSFARRDILLIKKLYISIVA